jgi:hypothetical protein
MSKEAKNHKQIVPQTLALYWSTLLLLLSGSLA